MSNEPFTHELVRFDLRRRGFPDPLLVVSDGAPGVIRAIEECFPRSARQRRLAHKLRNLQSKVPEGSVAGVQGAGASCYQAASPALARMLRDDIVATYGAALPSPLASLRTTPGSAARTSVWPKNCSPGSPEYNCRMDW